MTGSIRPERPAFLVDPAGTFIAAASQSVQALAGSGAVQLAGGAVLTLATAPGTSTFAGVIGGAGGISIAGPGTQVFAGANSYAGGTVISGGTLALALGGTFGNGTATTSVDGAAAPP